MIHRQIGLRGAVRVGLIMARAVRPPLQLSIIKKDLTRIQHLLSLRDRRMTITGMQKHLTLTGAHEVVLLIRDVHAVAVHFVQAVLIRKTIESENIARIDRFHRSGMQVGIEPGRLNYPAPETLDKAASCRLTGHPNHVFLWSERESVLPQRWKR